MATGLIALLDDVAAIAKVAAATLDDAAAQATKVGAKATGIVIDDAAVTPRYVVGFASERELPIIARIAAGSLRNKAIILPLALLLSSLAPWAITPLLMIGGAYLCLEGYHKVLDLISPHHPEGYVPEQEGAPTPQTPEELEAEKIASAVRTDFILSAEIMAISLAAVAASPIWLQGLLLAVVGLGMTVLVYGAVAIIVKADDVGAAMARSRSGLARVAGRGIVIGMPKFLKALSLIGMLAMLWVGGGILVHGLYSLGAPQPEQLIHQIAEAVGHAAAPVAGAVEWFVTAAISAVIGLAVGAAVDPVAKRAIARAFGAARAALKR